MTPKLGTDYDFLMMSEYVALLAQATPMTVHGMVESKMKNSVKKYNLGNSVYLRIYCHALSI